MAGDPAKSHGADPPRGGAAVAERPLADDGEPEVAALDAEAGVSEGAERRGDAATDKTDWRSPRHLWQIPTILASLVLIVLGLKAVIGPKAPPDFDGALAQIEQMIDDGEVDAAAKRLKTVIEPNLAAANAEQKAEFHALVADLAYLTRQAGSAGRGGGGEGGHGGAGGEPEARRHAIEHYNLAEELGQSLKPARWERLIGALIELGEFDAARKRLASLGKLMAEPQMAGGSHGASESGEGAAPDSGAGTERAASIAGAHERSFRKLIDAGVRQTDLPFDETMVLLAEYRLTHLDPVDEAWTAARMAELRLAAGQAEAAVSQLIVDLRRLEGSQAPLGELQAVLGRAYYELGRYELARQHLEPALAMMPSSEVAHGAALITMGALAMARDEPEPAFELFDRVVRDYPATPHYLPALLGRAEAASLLGEHAESQADYREAIELVGRDAKRRDVTPGRIADSLCDRHDASLALGRLDRALEYISLAEQLFGPIETSRAVLIRLASTNMQLADDALVRAEAALPHGASAADIDPAVRYEANVRYGLAGDFYARHAEADGSEPLSDDTWASSLWSAADCYDRGGHFEQAIERFRRYLDTQPVDDPQRSDAILRLAQVHHALLDCDSAIELYQKLIAEMPRSHAAATAHVPLARCLLAAGRSEEARAQLLRVLSGSVLLNPESSEYRDALVQLGHIHHEAGEFVPAIERLTEAIERYPTHPQTVDAIFLLADSYRRNALATAERLREETSLSPSEVNRLNALRTEHLQTAMKWFGEVCARTGEGSQSASIIPAPPARDEARRAWLYRADCAFELGQFDHAIDLYEQSARLYSSESSSMYALVQVVNCYSAIGDANRAAAAHARAIARLKQLPEAAFEAPDALLDRAAWERWLETRPPRVGIETASANAAGSEEMTP